MARPGLHVFGIPAALCAAWTIFAGKDVNWDLLNYHYYIPYQLLAGRVGQDFFAAAAQSYLNPLGYLPFYAMVGAQWHSVLISVVLAVAQSASIALLYVIAWRLFAHLPQRERIVLSALAAALGSATAVFWTTVGSSFLDPLLVPLMLGGLLLLLAQKRPLFAGLLFGAAAALKYSNATFALAAFPLVAMLGLRSALLYIAGGAVAVAALAGPWLLLMWREFANPVFPLFNAWFESPHAPAAHLVHLRFTPQNVVDAITFPFRMALLQRSLYVEIFAPDIRFSALVLAAIALPVFRRTSAGLLRAIDWRLLGFFAIAAVLWLATSANGRYGMLVLMLGGVCLARLVERLLPLSAARIALGVLLVLQIATTMLVAPPRWFVVEPWTKRWLPYEAPQAALREPALFLTLETLPMAVVAPFVHPQSAFVNIRGQQSLPPDSPRLAELLERHRGRVRALGRALVLVDGKPAPIEVDAYDSTLERFGYALDTSDCYTIEWRRDSPSDAGWLSRMANAVSRAAPTNERLSVGSCALHPAAPNPVRVAAEQRFSALFDRVERACPKLFRGQTAVTEPFGGGWSRHYTALDARLESIGEWVVLNRYRAGLIVVLGRLEDWAARESAIPEPCR